MIRYFSYGAKLNIIAITIMAAFTVISDARMREALCWFERSGGNVADVTILLRWYMFDRLSSTDATIMAGRAIVKVDSYMVKRRTCKGREVFMTRVAIRSGWQMISEFTCTDCIVMARFTVTGDTAMIIAAGGEGAHAMANTTILNGRHVVGRFTAGIKTMAGCTIVCDRRMIDECTSETISVMARSTIGTGCRMPAHCSCFSGRVNTVAIIVAQFTRLYCWIYQAVIENTTEAESLYAMTGSAIDVCYRMAD